MPFSDEWEAAFRAGTHLSIWPWSDLVSYVHRYAPPGQDFNRILELGCGVGANVPFFLRLGLDYYAVEGSNTAVDHVCAEHPGLVGKIAVVDFTQSIPFGGPFDLVIDRAALTHNTTSAISRALQMVCDRLRPGGRFIGIDWFSTKHRDARAGEKVDSYTRRAIASGPFLDVGNVHFCDQSHIEDLVKSAGLGLVVLEHKVTQSIAPETGNRFAYWHFVAEKPL